MQRLPASLTDPRLNAIREDGYQALRGETPVFANPHTGRAERLAWREGWAECAIHMEEEADIAASLAAQRSRAA
jgi:hypothetical protein